MGKTEDAPPAGAARRAPVLTRFWDSSAGQLLPPFLSDWSRALQPAAALHADADHPDIYYGDITTFAYEPAFEYLCRRVMLTGENVLPDYEFFDWTITPHADGPRNLRILPTSVADEADQPLPDILRRKTRFCAFLYANPHCAPRNEFLEILARHRRVDSLGPLMRNVRDAHTASPRFRDDWMDGAVEVQRAYKFAVSFESSLGAGYTSEKICLAFRANAVPIYWGNPKIVEDYCAESFINAHDFPSFEALAEHVLKVDADDDLYRSYLAASRLHQPIHKIYDDQIARRERFVRTIHTQPLGGRGAPVGQTDMFQREVCSRLHCKVVEPIIASILARFDRRAREHYFEGMYDV